MEGVYIKKLKLIPDERGRLLEFLRCDDLIFTQFGQVYITTVLPGVTKAWHGHDQQRDYMGCIAGMIKLVLYDDRTDSPSRGLLKEYFIGEHNPLLISIPPKVWHGFKGIDCRESIIINCPDRPYNEKEPDEFRLPPHSSKIPYDWSRRDG